MNKKGFILELGAIIVIVLTTVGIILTVSNSNNLYIGNKENGKYLNYFKCKDIANEINETNVIIFKSKAQAQIDYEPLEGCE